MLEPEVRWVGGRTEPARLIWARLGERTPAVVSAEGMRRAAVIVPLFFRAGEAYVLFTQRTEDVPTHKGQISFPGGMVEPEDGGLAAAALRETFEEVGVRPDQVQVLGQLDDMPTSSAPFVITPFVGLSRTARRTSPATAK